MYLDDGTNELHLNKYNNKGDTIVSQQLDDIPTQYFYPQDFSIITWGLDDLMTYG